MEPRQCAASVLESLMGFDERKSQHHAPVHSKVFSDDYLQRVASIGISKKKSPSRCQPFRMIVEEPTELFNSCKVENNFCFCNELWERDKADSTLSAAYMPLTRHTIMNEKDFSTGKVIRTSKDFQDLPEVLDSMDISPRPTRGKNSIFNQAENGSSVSKAHYNLTEGNNDTGTKFKDGKQGQAFLSEDLDFLNSSRPFLERKDKLCFSSSSPTSLKGSHVVNDKWKDCHSSRNEKHIANEKERTMEYAVQPIKQPSQVSSILDGSRRTTRCDFVNLDLKTSRSETIYDDVLRNETKYKRNSSPNLSNWMAEYKHSCFFSVESYKARESREKVIEEQRKTENLMLSTRDRKESEMPTLPHYVTFPSDLNCKCKPVKYDFQNHVCSNMEHMHSGSPLCLNWKVNRLDQLSKNPHRLRFDSTSSVTTRSRTRSRYEALRNTWFLKHEGPGTWLQCKPSNRCSNKKEPTLKLSSKKLKIFPCPDSASDHVDNAGSMVGDDLKTTVDKKDLCDEHSLNCLSPRGKVVFCTQNIPVKQENQATSIQQKGLAFEHYPSKEQDSIVSLEEAFQPSPVSVLEPLFKEETLFSSESSGINSRDLMMQLELLMSDSPGTNSEGHDLFVSSDEDGGEGSHICSSDEIDDTMSTFKFKDSRDFSYLVDVLSEATIHCKILETDSVPWHGQEHHIINPIVFEILEKKFGDQISWRRSERKLLFDRINSGLVELFQSFHGVPEWAKPVSRRFRPLLNHEMIEEELWILLDSQEREVNKDLVDKQFGKEIGWIDLGDEIDSICREVERLLVNELVAEFGSIELF